jgi:DNA-binding NtrC family response regulator
MDRQAIQERFGIIGASDPLRRAIDRVRQIGRTGITVLLEGESGVGKELFATLTHELSPRRHRPLVVVNCGAIPEGLIESELFGAEKGAYTGSVERRAGYFEEADGGTIFLDEIGEMPLQAQVRLLRVLESGAFSRVGSSTQQRADVRVIAATNKDLGQEVREGRFREDLYYRLSTVVIRVPPLRERPEDVLPLFEHFLYRAAQRYEAPLRRLDTSARDLLVRYNWPGNVRELRNVAEQAAVLVRGETATADDLRPFLRGVSAALGLAPATPHPAAGGGREQELIYRALLELRMEVRELKDLVRRMGGAVPALPPGPTLDASELAEGEEFAYIPDDPPAEYHGAAEDVPYEIELEEPGPFSGGYDPRYAEAFGQGADGPDVGDSPLHIGSGPLPTVEEAEQALITEALRRFGGNRRQTAKALGISERTLYRKLKDLEDAGVEV